jgi:hypothetical protein
MKMLKTICHELFGLFVDDSSLALVILALLAASALLMHAGLMDRDHAMYLLVAGNIVALIENVVRSQKRG